MRTNTVIIYLIALPEEGVIFVNFLKDENTN